MRNIGLFIVMALATVVSCTNNECVSLQDDKMQTPATRSLQTPFFDWENADWMPTPYGQSRIPSPWVGAGSLVSTYGIDISNDRFRSNGWELVYNTFDPNAPGPLVNPYFVLYNKYNGLLRIYLYITTQFITTSSYLQDGISIVSNHNTQLLNFLGREFIDATENRVKNYWQTQPTPSDGSCPLAANKWYMMQYELAYDPVNEQIPYNEIQLAWCLNYINIQEVDLGGEQQGVLNGIIGGASTDSRSFFSKLQDTEEQIGTGVLAGIGSNIITNNTINEKTGENKLGLPNVIFKAISTGLTSALSGALNKLPATIINAVFSLAAGGASPTPVSLQLSTRIHLSGNISEQGSVPSTPISFWLPGTNFTQDAVGYIPLYNKNLGVVNFKGRPTIDTYQKSYIANDEDMYGLPYEAQYTYLYLPKTFDYSSYLIINPEVTTIANVVVKKQELLSNVDKTIEVNPEYIYWDDGWNPYTIIPKPTTLIFAVRFTLEVQPKNGDTTSTIIKTFELEEHCVSSEYIDQRN